MRKGSLGGIHLVSHDFVVCGYHDGEDGYVDCVLLELER